MGELKQPLKDEWPRICHNNDNVYHLLVAYYIKNYYASHCNHLACTMLLWDKYYHPHFTSQESVPERHKNAMRSYN